MPKTLSSISRILLSGAAAALSLAVASAASAQSDPAKLTFQLNYPAAGYNAGFELAAEKGFYTDAGLEIDIEPGNGSQITAQLVAAGKVDIAFADAAPVMKLISQGAKMRVLATILQGNPNQVTALKKTGLKSAADMKGRSVAVPNGGSQAAMFPLVLAANGLKESDIKVVNMPPDSMVPSLLNGTVDVILGSVDAYGPQLKSMNVDTDNFLFIDSGAPTVSTSIIASDAFLAEHPDQAKAFVAASLKGWSAAIDDPSAAISAMTGMFPDANAKLAPGQLDATLFLMCVNNARFVGRAEPQQWADTVKSLSEIGVLPADIPADRYYTYDYLPAEATLRSCPLK
ncbi:MAG: ABC transporter substrate-binding protein [Inquilinus sp.]|uniref:ABC transporter substrate-binding protein n=1 Tax=Inquilinus sp. TaxID=1932117 RepID=UPI003F397D62